MLQLQRLESDFPSINFQTQPNQTIIAFSWRSTPSKETNWTTSFLFPFPFLGFLFQHFFLLLYSFPDSTLPIQDYWYKPSSAKQNDSSAMLSIKDISKITPRQRDRMKYANDICSTSILPSSACDVYSCVRAPYAQQFWSCCVISSERIYLCLQFYLSNAWRFISHAFLPLTMYWGHSR